jgi:hypothetical protein
MKVQQHDRLQGNGLSNHSLGQDLLRAYADDIRSFRKEYLSSSAAPWPHEFNSQRFSDGVLWLQSGWSSIFDEAGQYSGLPDEERTMGLMLRVTVLGDAITELLSYARKHGLMKRERDTSGTDPKSELT